MSRTGWNRRVASAGWPARLALPRPLALAMVAGLVGSPIHHAQAQVVTSTPDPVPVSAAEAAAVVAEAAAAPAAAALAHEIQVVRFQGPAGAKVEVLGPAAEVVPQGDGKGLATVGLKVGVGYQIKLSNLPDRPGVSLYPMVEIVGHLHRPKNIDPAKYPIRIVFRDDDIEQAADRGRLITQVVYLEDPEQAVPLKLPKDEPPYVDLSPAEDPLKVARALGRVMAVVRIGGRQPTAEEVNGPSGLGLAAIPCPFMNPGSGGPCGLPCGPVTGTPPPRGRSWMPRDEFLCDGGDSNEAVHFAGEGGLLGIDPRDTVVNFRADDRPRLLPTNVVCVYAPRFASVRATVGVNETLSALQAISAEMLQGQQLASTKLGPKKLAASQTAEANRLRVKASSLAVRVAAGEHSEVRVLGGFDASVTNLAYMGIQSADRKTSVTVLGAVKQRVKLDGVKSAESAVVTGIVEGAGQMVMSWKPQAVESIEVPPKKPGLAVIKQVNATEAEPGDTLIYSIQYRNMGNTPIRAVTIIDSLLPRLEYVPGSAQGPADTIFTFAENKAGALELRWDLPGAIAPGAEGSVMFKVIVR